MKVLGIIVLIVIAVAVLANHGRLGRLEGSRPGHSEAKSVKLIAAKSF